LIIADHHQPGPERPPALAVINPHDPLSRYPFRDLCGTAVAWRLACALGRAPEEDLDLVATATVADVVPLLGENRTIVQEGLRRLRAGRGRPGVLALLGEGVPTARDLAFRVAPRLNAPGRMGDAGPALRLLLAEGPVSVSDALAAIEAASAERREAEAAVAVSLDGSSADPFVFLYGEDWHVGVLGLVASRLCEEAGKPVFLLGRSGDGWRGSVRAPAGWDATAWLTACAAHLDRFGGHPGAAGFECRNPETLAEALRRYLPSSAAGGSPVWPLDGELLPAELTLDTAQALAALEPHGEGNPQPRLVLRAAPARQVRTVGQSGRHLKLTLQGVDAIGFGLGYAAAGLQEGSRWDVCCALRRDDYRGKARLQLDVLDLRPAEGDWAGFLAAFPDRPPLVNAYKGLRTMAARGPLPALPVLPLQLSAAAGLPLPTARAAAAIFGELGLIAGAELRSEAVDLAASPTFRLAAQVRERCRAIIL
ncbi:MAG TPA: DHHA1 domain-containing protein, partial [Bacillota bacterium]|nr:DHHA1 domain-containing protein [Bacillota bacterium]